MLSKNAICMCTCILEQTIKMAHSVIRITVIKLKPKTLNLNKSDNKKIIF